MITDEFWFAAWAVFYAVTVSSGAYALLMVYLRYMYPERYSISVIGPLMGMTKSSTLADLPVPARSLVIFLQGIAGFVIYGFGIPSMVAVAFAVAGGWFIAFVSHFIPNVLLDNIMTEQDRNVLNRAPTLMKWMHDQQARLRAGLQLRPFVWTTKSEENKE